MDALSSAHVYLRLPEGAALADIPGDTLEDAAQLVKANSIQGNKVNNLEVVYTPAANLKKAASMDVGQVGFHDQKAVKKVSVLKRVNDVVNRLNKTRREEYPDLAAEREAWDREQRSRGKAEAQVGRREAAPLGAGWDRRGQEAVHCRGLAVCARLVWVGPDARRSRASLLTAAPPAGCPLPLQAQRLVDKEARDEGKRAADMRSYKGVMDEEHMTSAAEMRERYATVEDYEDDFL